jgi:transposase
MQDAIDQLPSELKVYVQSLQHENLLLRQQLRLARIDKYGQRSEKLSDNQLELLEGELSVTSAEIAQEATQAEENVSTPPKTKRKHPGRAGFPVHLERKEVKIPCAPEDCICRHCHNEKSIITYERNEELEVIPAYYYVKVILREKRACHRHPEGGVQTAPPPVKIIPKGKLSNGMVVDVLVKKYGDHLPAYRQSMILERDAKIDLSRKTLISTIMKAGELLEALIPPLKLDLFEKGYIQADETRVPCQSLLVEGKNHKAFMWEYSRPGGPVIFDFQMGRSRAGPEEFLQGFKGLLQTDGYSAYNKLGQKIEYAACWSHARREFHRAHKLATKDSRPLEILDLIGRLYGVEEQAREKRASHDQRVCMRKDTSQEIVGKLKERIIAIRSESDVLPKSQLGKACNYAFNRWDRLEMFLKHGQLEIDNNWCENAIRPFAVGRKNWLHLGSESAGPRVAAIASIFETCKRLEINVRNYLLDILPQLPEWPINRVAYLSPIAWKARQGVINPPSSISA